MVVMLLTVVMVVVVVVVVSYASAWLQTAERKGQEGMW